MVAFVKGIMNILFCHVLYRVRFIHKEREEATPKCVLFANHSNTLEPTWIYAKTKSICIMAKAELFRIKWIGKLFEHFGVFPIHRGERDIKSLLHAIRLFKNIDERKLLIFPEGTRMAEDTAMGDPKVGAAYIAYKAGVPIIPVYISKNVSLFSRAFVVYGNPIMVTKQIAEDKEKLQQFTDEILKSTYLLANDIKNGGKRTC